MKTNRNQKRAGLKVRTDIRAGAYFSITFGAGGGTPGAQAVPESTVVEVAPAA